MTRPVLNPDGLHHTLAKLVLVCAFKAARDVNYASNSQEMAALERAEAVWAEMKHAA